MENLMMQVVLAKINNKTSLHSLYLKTIKRQQIYASIEGSKVVFVILNVIMQV
jgi:hypothetical protein